MNENNIIPFNVNESDIWLGNKFFDPTSNLVLEIKDFIDKRFELDKEIKKAYAVDGKIIGTGEADFTKDYITYELNYQNKVFYLVDMPGIEGDESKYESVIKNALEKAHSVVYVNGTNKKPEVGTIEKIKKYLRDNCSVYSVVNVKGKADTYEFDEDRISLDTTHKDANEVAQETSNILSKVFNDGAYEKSMIVQGLIAFSSVAHIDNISTVDDSRKQDLKKSQEKYLKYFKSYDSMRDFSRINDIASIIESKVNTFEDDIKRSNVKKILGRINEVLNIIIIEHNKYKEMSDNFRKEIKDFKNSVSDYIYSFEKDLENKFVNSYDAFFRNVLNAMYKEIDTMGRIVSKDDKDRMQRNIENFVEKEKPAIEKQLKKVSDELIKELISNIENRLKRLESDFRKISEISSFNDISSGNYISMDNIFSEMNIEFADIAKGIFGIASFIMTGIGVGSIFPGMGNIIGGIIGGVLGLAFAALDFFNPNRKRERAKAKAREDIDDMKKEARSKIKNMIKDMRKDINVSVNEINSKLDAIYDKQIKILKLLNTKKDKLEIIQEKLKEI